MALVMMNSPASAVAVMDFEQAYIQGGTAREVGSVWQSFDIPMEVMKDIKGDNRV
jgi:hypothetical protein